MKLVSKPELAAKIHSLADGKWYPSTKITVDRRNDGAVGNTLESLLGIQENNLPIPNANEWELKGQRSNTTSLITLKHIEPSPRSLRFVPRILLPNYGWRHASAGAKYPDTEMSFRSTTSAVGYTNRGFKIEVDRAREQLRFVFDPLKSNYENDEDILAWLESVDQRTGLAPLAPEFPTGASATFSVRSVQNL